MGCLNSSQNKSDRQEMARILAKNSQGENNVNDFDDKMMDWLCSMIEPKKIQDIYQKCGKDKCPSKEAHGHIYNPQIFEAKIVELEQGKINPENQNKNKPSRHFINWGKTVNQYYEKISFPKNKEQVRQCVKKAISQGKSIRGSGIRHSWSNIFADPGNMLVSFYPYQQSVGSSQKLQMFADKMLNNPKQLNNPDSLYCIIEMPIPHNFKLSPKKDKLVKIGAGVSNEQLRRWCIEHELQYDANVIMVEVNFCGALGTCSHGSGIKNPPLCDSIVEIEFVNCKGEFQTINKWDHPELIGSAAGSLGLIGLYVSVTIQMGELQTAHYRTRKQSPQKIIPRPGSDIHSQNFKAFKQECNSSYSEWFYFTKQRHIFKLAFSNVFNAQKREKDAQVIEFPPKFIKRLAELGTQVAGMNQKVSSLNIPLVSGIAQQATYLMLKNPYFAFPGEVPQQSIAGVFGKKMNKFNYMDAIHFQRGIQNFHCRDMQLEIQVPIINGQMDYALIQRAWWKAMDYIDDGRENVIDLALQMRLFKGSKCSLAPEIDFDVVCSIQILRTMPDNPKEFKQWKKACEDVYKIWSDLEDSNGNPVILRPHWGKEWDQSDAMKKRLLNEDGTDEKYSMIPHFRNFLKDYKKIGEIGQWSVEQGLKVFSNKRYNEFITKAQKNP